MVSWMRSARLASAMLLLVAGCTGAARSPSQEVGMELRSEAFDEGGAIPSVHTCDGNDTSPPLAWEGVPEGTAAFALIVDDPDARGFIHWVLSDIPGDATGLPEGEGDAIGVPGRNDFGRTGWGGPCPPSGQHRYVFTLYALSAPIQLAGTPDASSVRSGMRGLTLGEAPLSGVYTRGG